MEGKKMLAWRGAAVILVEYWPLTSIGKQMTESCWWT